jgi:hypothetical protein
VCSLVVLNFTGFTNAKSSLLRSIVTQAPIVADRSAQTDGVGLDANELLALARLSFTGLAELRHRGAFSAVAQAFAACCKRCDDANRKDILDVLYAVRCNFLEDSHLYLIACRTLWLVFDSKVRRLQGDLPAFPQ